MKTMMNRLGWAIAGALALAVLAVAAKAVQGGPLDPPGAPGSTMRTLADLVPAWDQTLTSNGCGSQRWTCVLGGAGVLDNETGLVWEKTPIYNGTDTWLNAQTLCTSDPAGGRYGWRLPAAEELLSLKDSTVGNLPANTPFTGVDDFTFWSSTVAPDDDSQARYISYSLFASNEQSAPKTQANIAGIWCVRGGPAESGQVANGVTAWSRKLSAIGTDSCNSQRFTCVMDGEGVLDHETGIVWQRDLNFGNNTTWTLFNGDNQCVGAVIGGRTGWRLPSAGELGAMLDQSQSPSLPFGHPFQNVNSNVVGYWSSTAVASDTSAYHVALLASAVAPFQGFMSYTIPTNQGYLWCVRGATPD